MLKALKTFSFERRDCKEIFFTEKRRLPR